MPGNDFSAMTARQWQVFLAVSIPAFFLAIAFVAWLTIHNGVGDGAGPESVTRDQMVTSYRQLAPGDHATPTELADLANSVCDRLTWGTNPDTLASDLADIYHGVDRARSVLRVLTSYGCPELTATI